MTETQDSQDLLESTLQNPFLATVFFGSILIVALIVKIPALLFHDSSSNPSDLWPFASTMLLFAAGAGVPGALLRRYVVGRKSLRTKNLVTGTCAGISYGSACILTFGGSTPVLWALGGVVALAIAWAVTSALNDICRP